MLRSLPLSLALLTAFFTLLTHTAVATPPIAAVASPTSPPATEVSVAVDRRVELLTIVARLAGAREFLMPNSQSPYAERVAAHFGPFQNHAAVKAYQAIRAEHGASYDAIASLALHLDGVPTLAERIPFDRSPPRLDARWAVEPTRAFLVALRAFVVESKAEAFFAAEQPFYDHCAAKVAPVLAKANAVEWFDRFFGSKPAASYQAIPGLLCGGGNYGVGVRFLDGAPEEIRPVLGIYRWDAEGLPAYGERDVETYVHELCHSYTNVIVDRHLDILRPAGTRLYPIVAQRMSRMAYGSWETMMYETFVRACVVRYLADVQSPEAAAKEASVQRETGFAWVPDVAERLATYAKARDRYPTLDAFLPEIVAVLDAKAESMVTEAAAAEKNAPKLLGITPPNGAKDVAKDLTTMVLRFDRPMSTKSWSFVGSKDDVPEMVGAPAWSADATTLTATVKLVPGRTYHFWLNSERFNGFRAANGAPLSSVEVTFTIEGE
ncbi:MAG: DUF4932 domain-containing protein [Phycisphaerae bacterium]|nr:DUF4932 domain-containing protein [Phycisphaerae bacterium]